MIKRILIDEIKFVQDRRIEYPDHDGTMRALVRDLKANGQQVPIVVLADYSLVDGLRRVMALNTAGIKEVDAVVASTLEEAIEGLRINHGGKFPDRLRRIWEIQKVLNPLVHERRKRLARERMLGVSRTQWAPSTVVGARFLFEEALGRGYDKVVQVYRLAFDVRPPGWRDVLRDLENGTIYVGGAYNKLRGIRPLMGNIRTVKDQEQLVNGAARQLEAVVLALKKLAWPIVIPVDRRQAAIDQLRKNRGELSRIIHLLEEAESE